MSKGKREKAETNQKPAPTSEAGSWKITPFAAQLELEAKEKELVPTALVP